MNKQLISFLIILLVVSLGIVSAGNNTTESALDATQRKWLKDNTIV